MPPKTRGLTPPRSAAKKPVRTTDSAMSASNIRSLSPTRNYSGTKPNTDRQNSSASVTSDDSAGSGGPLWQMPRRGGSGPAPMEKAHPKKFKSTPARAQAPVKPQSVKWQRDEPTSHSERTPVKPQSVKWERNKPLSKSESEARAQESVKPQSVKWQRNGPTSPPVSAQKTRGRTSVVIDVSSSEEGSDSDSSIEILVPPKTRQLSGRDKRKSLPDRTESMNDQRAAKTPAKAVNPASPKPDSSRSARTINSTNATKPLSRQQSLNAAATSPTASDKSQSATTGNRSRARSHSPDLISEEPKRSASKGASLKRGATGSPVADTSSPSKQSAAAKFKNTEAAKKESVRPVSPVRTKPSTNSLPPTLSPPFKEKRPVAHDRRQTMPVDGRATRDKSPFRNGRRVASMATDEAPSVSPSRPSNPAPPHNAPPVPPSAGFANSDPTLTPPPVGKVDSRRATMAVDGRPVRERSPRRSFLPGRRVASMASDENIPVLPRASQMDLDGGQQASGSRMPGRRVASMAADERPPAVRRSKSGDLPPRQRSVATEDMPRGRPQSIRMGGSGTGRSPPPRSSSARSPPPRSSSGKGGGRGRGGTPQQREFDSLQQMPASLKNRYGAQLGRFASSGGRGAGGRGGKSVFSGRVTADGRKVPIAPTVNKNKIVIPTQGAPYSAAGRPMGPGRGRGREEQSSRAPAAAPPVGRKKKRDPESSIGLGGSERSSGSRSPTNVPRPVSPVRDGKKKIFTKIRPDEPFMFPVDDVAANIVHDIAQPGGSVRILICSANLGNAQPDELSLNEWIPVNGNMGHVLTTPLRYPVMLNFPSEEKESIGNIAFSDRATHKKARTRQSELVTISEHMGFDLDEEEDSEIFSPPLNRPFVSLPNLDDDVEVPLNQLYRSLPSSEIVVETVDEEADDDDQSVLQEETLELTRSLRTSFEKKPATTTEGLIDESERSELPEEVEPEVAEPAEASEAINPPEPAAIAEETEPAESKDAAPETDEIDDELEETERDTSEEGKDDDVLINSPNRESQQIELASAPSSGTPKRYTASSEKLDSIRKRIEDSIKKSKTEGFAFGDAFHERQRIMAEAERLKAQEARENLHLGSMAPDKASTYGETFLVQQTGTKKEDREKQRATRDLMTRGSLGIFGKKKNKSGDQGSSSLSPQTPQKKNIYLQALPAEILVSPKSASRLDENGELKGDHPVESISHNIGTKTDENDLRGDKGKESLEMTGSFDAIANPNVDHVLNPDEKPANPGDDAMLDLERSAPTTGSQTNNATSIVPRAKDSLENVQLQAKGDEDADGLEPTLGKEDPKYPAKGDGNDYVDEHESNSLGNGAFDLVGEDDDLENENIGKAMRDFKKDEFIADDSLDGWDNGEMVDPEPYYEEGPEGHFEIIVIGMQEATFDPDKDPDKKSEKGGSERSPRTEETSDSDGSVGDDNDDEGSEYEDEKDDEDDEEECGDDDEGRLGSSDDECSIEDAPKSSKSTSSSEKVELSSKKSKGFLRIATKAGKGAMKAGKGALGKGKKKLKAARKTSKAVKTLMSARNHTKRELPFMRQEISPSEDGAMAKWEDTDVLHFLFDGQLPSYERALSYQLGEMRLMVYYLKTSVELDVLSVKAKPTGKANLANKGGIVTEVAVNGATRLCFSSAHLEAHEGEKKFEKRCKSFERIFSAASSSVTAFNFDPTMASHYSFFMGDLNFRTRLPDFEPGSDEHIQASHALAAAKRWNVLNRHDELSNALVDNKCLAGWKTPYCNFDPTFKVARQDGYQYNVLRSPSYTDRILYKAIDQLEDSLEVSLYEPITNFTSSDHKPIRGAFEIQLNEKLDLKPRIPTLKKEKLHILFTSIELFLYSDKYKLKTKPKGEDEVVKPNPFVSFISTPRDALELDALSSRRSTWKRFGQKRGLVRTKPGRTKSDVGSSKFNPLSAQWPGTSVKENTFNPKWENDEIHFELGTKNKTNNRPLDLSGALMHVAVFDQRESNPKPLGSFTLNLASLIQVTKESDKNKPGNVPEGRSRFGRGKLAKQESFREKMVKQPSKRLTGLIDSLADELDQDSEESKRLKELKITTLKFEEALVESGVQTGDIKCTVDAWWMHDEEEE